MAILLATTAYVARFALTGIELHYLVSSFDLVRHAPYVATIATGAGAAR